MRLILARGEEKVRRKGIRNILRSQKAPDAFSFRIHVTTNELSQCGMKTRSCSSFCILRSAFRIGERQRGQQNPHITLGMTSQSVERGRQEQRVAGDQIPDSFAGPQSAAA